MASASTRRTDRHDRHDSGAATRPVVKRHLPFTGLFLAAPVALLTAWVMHAYLRGVDVAWNVGRFNLLDWHLAGSSVAWTVTVVLLTLTAVGLSVWAWHASDSRKTPLRVALAGSVGVAVTDFGLQVGIGPGRWTSFFGVIAWWIVAGVWVLPRLDVTRRDPRVEEPQQEDGLVDKLGLRGFGFRKRQTVLDEDGEPLRTDIDVQHASGGTIDPVQKAVPAFESMAAAPSGLSRAVQRERADQSTLSIFHKDPLAGRLRFPGPSHPGGSIADPIRFGKYDDATVAVARLGGGDGFSPTGYGLMGATRTGKTTAENQVLAEVITRRDAVILYLNRAKGSQDSRPILPGVEVAVLADEIGPHKSALLRVKNIISYREKRLAQFGISEWRAETCWHNPPPGMEPMPALIVHVGEADAVLEALGTTAVYLASKGLSVGVLCGWSLQRADGEHMPTGLRFNVGTWWCFGCGDNYSADFALSEHTRAAGAAPERWKQAHPGKCYFEGPGVPEENWPKVIKTFSGDSSEALQAELLAITSEWAPRMARLDSGSVEATQGWWPLATAETDRVRASLIGGGPVPFTPPAPPSESSAQAVDGFDADTDDYDENAPSDDEIRKAVRDAVDAVTEVDGLPLYEDESERRIDPAVDVPAEPGDDLEWGDDKPEAPTRELAVAAFDKALLELSGDPALRDPADPSGQTVIISPALLLERYPFRERPWFSAELSLLADGERIAPPGLSLSRAEDLGLRAGKYRLNRLPGS